MKYFTALWIFLLTLEKSWACVGCGQESYTPKMLLVGSVFALLPLSLVGLIIWVLRKESKVNKNNEPHS